MPTEPRLCWYLAYGSNLQQERFACYLGGGRPADAARTYVGARDTSVPRRWEPLRVPGRMVFAGESLVWGGGVAVLDPRGPGEVAGRAYLLTLEQLDDVVAQEVGAGSGLYDAVVALPDLDDVPVRAVGTRLDPVPTAPAAAYLRRVVHGLVETFAWSAEQCADYLLGTAGVAPAWSRRELVVLHPDRSI
jgi:hypothetical protein